MRAPLSIVIPTLNAEGSLPETLECLVEGLEAGLVRELIVTDGQSEDHTVQIAQAVGAETVIGAPSRGGQLARGCAMAKGEWLLVLHADTRFDPGWTDAVRTAMRSDAPGYFRLRFDARGLGPLVVASWANFRARAFGLPFGDQGLLMRRDVYSAAGGYNDIALMEDIALVRVLPPVRQIECGALTSWARYAKRGWLRQGAGNLIRQIRFALGADPKDLARRYF